MRDTHVRQTVPDGGAAAWLWRPRPNPQAAGRLFCFPCAGRGASLFRGWAERVPAAIEVCAVQYPGREQRLREAPFTRMPDLVAGVAEALWPLLDRPYAVFGHSIGALVGFECARQLRRQGHPEPAHLMLGARRAAHVPERHEPIGHLPQTEFIAAIRERYDGIPAEVLRHPDLMDLLLPTLRADIQLLEGYTHAEEHPLGCAITCFGGREDREATLQDLEGWREHTTGAFAVRMFPGGHFFLQSAQADVMGTIRQILGGVIGEAMVRAGRA